jgi:hypothetical protein
MTILKASIQQKLDFKNRHYLEILVDSIGSIDFCFLWNGGDF